MFDAVLSARSAATFARSFKSSRPDFDDAVGTHAGTGR